MIYAGESATIPKMDGPETRLKRARIAAGFKTAQEAFDRFKQSWGYESISRYRGHENGQNPFNEEQARNYARSYNTTPGHLLWNEERPNEIIPQMARYAPDSELTADVIAALVRVLKPRLPEEDADRVTKVVLDLFAGPRESPDRLRERLLMGFATRKLSKDGDGID